MRYTAAQKTCALIFALCLAGCGEEVKRDQFIPLAEAPPELLKVAQQKRPDLKFDAVWKVKFKGQDAYEFRGKSKTGETHEVELSPDGKLLEIE